MNFLGMKKYELTMELYTEVSVQDPETGSIVKTWNYNNPQIVKCKAHSVRPWGSVEDFGATYTDKEYLEIYCRTPVALAQRVGRIRNRKGLTLWKNDNGTATVFNVSGVSPSIAPNGRVTDYVLLLELLSVQPGLSA
ncbi:head-to-tail stopper [Streptomyces phage Mulchroom]|nr:head-to-tail stopper [Streptomyces phage Mulchroom]